MEPKEIRTRVAVVRLGEDGIIRQTIAAGVQEMLADAQENVQATVLLCPGGRTPVLVDLRGIKSQEREARLYYNSPIAIRASNAVALLVGSRVSMLIANFFIAITANNSSRPTRLFTDEAEAVKWLREFPRKALA